MNFFETFACRSRVHCLECRGNPEFRQSIVQTFTAPTDPEFECPNGIARNITEPPPRPRGVPPARRSKYEPIPHERWPQWAKRIERSQHRKPDDIGVGDTIRNKYARVGGETFKKWAKRLWIPCGCATRQERYNKQFPYEVTNANSN